MLENNADWGASGRTTSYSATLVDPFSLTETVSPDLELNLEGTSITYAYESDNHMEATIDLLSGDYRTTEGSRYEMDKMIRIYQTVGIDNEYGTYCMGTFYVSNLSNSSKFGMQKRKLTCYGPMWAFTQDVFARDFNRSAGQNCWDCMTDIVDYDNGHMRPGDGFDTSRTHTVDVWFPIGSNRAEALNKYAGWLNSEIVSDMDGYLRIRPYVAMSARDPVYTFEEGVNCIYLPGIEWETNRDEPINRVVAYFSRESKQDDPSKENYDPFPLSDYVYVDLPDSAEWSYARCGRRRTETLHITDPCSHEDLTATAQRELDEKSHANLYINIEHAGIPWLRVGDCVTYKNSNDFGEALVSKCVITEMSIGSLSPYCMTKTKMKVVG